ncbi:MAG: PhzF family phenazine biosynthesis protein [Bacteroidota bacterium]|jgi:PhzF family phenazine biosynthesis protein
MEIQIYQVDAFAEKLFSGNPAAVCVLDFWLDDQKMQSIAAENNLPETAFIVKNNKDNYFEIRWFTPEAEVELCGHATLASAHVLFKHLNIPGNQVTFFSKYSSWLYVNQINDELQLDFPQDVYQAVETPHLLIEAFGAKPLECYLGKTDYMLIFESKQQIQDFKPDFNLISKAGKRGVIVSAKGDYVDFVSRFFAPQLGIPEDPVTGSAHTLLAPYWSDKFGKTKLKALQLSKRGGQLTCQLVNDRVLISGKAITYLKGIIFI